MSSSNDITTGRCQCGNIRYSVSGPMREVIACHCKQCRRTVGSYFMATNAAADEVSIEDTAGTLTWFRDADYDWAERGFCKRCGSNLFWRADDSGTISITAGSIDEPSGVHVAAHIFVADKGDYYKIADEFPQHPASTGGIVPEN